MSAGEVRQTVDLGLKAAGELQEFTGIIQQTAETAMTSLEIAKIALERFLSAMETAQDALEQLPALTAQLPERAVTAARALHEASAGTNQYDFSDCAYRCDGLPAMATGTNDHRAQIAETLQHMRESLPVIPEDLDTLRTQGNGIQEAAKELHNTTGSILDTAQNIKY